MSIDVIKLCIYLETDIVPDPPDGPPVIEAITGKTITLRWKPPKRLDTFGRFVKFLSGENSLTISVQIKPTGKNCQETSLVDVHLFLVLF